MSTQRHPSRNKTLAGARLGGSVCLAVCLLAAASVAADEVLLSHGETFSGVIATEEGQHVTIRMDGGELRLPRAQVRHIEKAPSDLAAFLERSQQLLARDAEAAEWLSLARWALARDLEQSSREAGRRAARLDPDLPGLDRVLPVARPGSKARADELAASAAERRGLLDREEVLRQEREEDLARARFHQARLDQERRLAREEAEVAAAQERVRLQALAQIPYVPFVYSVPVPFVVWTGNFPATQPPSSPTPGARTPVPGIDLFERQPGSLIPASTGRGPG